MILRWAHALAAIVALSLISCSQSSSPDQRKDRAAADTELEARLKTTLTELGKRSDADISWMTSFRDRRGPLFQSRYTVDLEKLWLIDRSIVFIGILADVATESEADCRLIVESTDFKKPLLRLQILCAKSQVAPILAQVSSDRESLTPGVVLSAKITHLEHSTEPDKEGTKGVITGYGRCVAISYVGDAAEFSSR